MDVSKPYEFIKFEAMDVTKSYECMRFGDIYGPKSNRLTGPRATTLSHAPVGWPKVCPAGSQHKAVRTPLFEPRSYRFRRPWVPEGSLAGFWAVRF